MAQGIHTELTFTTLIHSKFVADSEDVRDVIFN